MSNEQRRRWKVGFSEQPCFLSFSLLLNGVSCHCSSRPPLMKLGAIGNTVKCRLQYSQSWKLPNLQSPSWRFLVLLLLFYGERHCISLDQEQNTLIAPTILNTNARVIMVIFEKNSWKSKDSGSSLHPPLHNVGVWAVRLRTLCAILHLPFICVGHLYVCRSKDAIPGHNVQ